MNRSLALLLLALVVGAGSASAQYHGLREVRGDAGMFGVNLAIGAPQGDFAQNVDVAGGIDAFAAVGNPVGLRLEGAYLVYGSDNQFDLNTTYAIATIGVGPQITVGQGPMRLYGFGTVGFSYISAYSSFPDGCGCYSYGSQTDFSDWTSALQAGGGVLLTLGRRTPVSLDIGARYLYSGFANYVAPGDVQPQPNGDIVVYTSRARPNLTVLHFGVSIGIR
ncbi:MAG TPA: hypothetical protein VKB63_13925 [Gemmatimonadales bacterium]|nr:hypothetical protein [Gemmatimonadales bacterium]